MFVKCEECGQHYDDLESKPRGVGLAHGHIAIGVRPVDQRIATRARAEHARRVCAQHAAKLASPAP